MFSKFVVVVVTGLLAGCVVPTQESSEYSGTIERQLYSGLRLEALQNIEAMEGICQGSSDYSYRMYHNTCAASRIHVYRGMLAILEGNYTQAEVRFTEAIKAVHAAGEYRDEYPMWLDTQQNALANIYYLSAYAKKLHGQPYQAALKQAYLLNPVMGGRNPACIKENRELRAPYPGTLCSIAGDYLATLPLNEQSHQRVVNFHKAWDEFKPGYKALEEKKNKKSRELYDRHGTITQESVENDVRYQKDAAQYVRSFRSALNQNGYSEYMTYIDGVLGHHEASEAMNRKNSPHAYAAVYGTQVNSQASVSSKIMGSLLSGYSQGLSAKGNTIDAAQVEAIASVMKGDDASTALNKAYADLGNSSTQPAIKAGGTGVGRSDNSKQQQQMQHQQSPEKQQEQQLQRQQAQRKQQEPQNPQPKKQDAENIKNDPRAFATECVQQISNKTERFQSGIHQRVKAFNKCGFNIYFVGVTADYKEGAGGIIRQGETIEIVYIDKGRGLMKHFKACNPEYDKDHYCAGQLDGLGGPLY